MSGTQWFYTVLAFVIPLSVYAWVVLYRYLTRDRIGNDSLRYAVDHLPMGIAFYMENGLLLLANGAMQALCRRVTGNALVNGHRFHAGLLAASSGAEAGEDDLVVALGPEVWSVRRTRVTLDGMHLFQLTAYDTTALSEKERELSVQVEHLRGIEADLKDFRNSVDALAGKEAWLAAKERIHDSLGQVLLSTRYYLTEPDALITGADLFETWQKTIGELTGEAQAGAEQKPPEHVLKPLEDAAAALGARLKTQGSFPADDIRLTRLVISCTRVCLINAVRHGAADEVALVFDGSAPAGEVCFRISDNGHLSAEGFREGGGLKSLRANVEKEGGTVHYETAPHFAVIVRVPVTTRPA